MGKSSNRKIVKTTKASPKLGKIQITKIENVASEFENFVKTIPKEFQKCISSISDAIQDLADGDPLLILHWNDDVITARTVLNQLFTKAALVAHIIACNGEELLANEAFRFRTMRELHECKETLPLWAISLGPQCCAIVGITVPDPVARAMLVLGTHRVIPDVSIFSFFQR